MRFQSETSVFKFLRRSVGEALDYVLSQNVSTKYTILSTEALLFFVRQQK